MCSSVRYEDPRAVEGLAGALDTRLQVTGAVSPILKPSLTATVTRTPTDLSLPVNRLAKVG